MMNASLTAISTSVRTGWRGICAALASGRTRSSACASTVRRRSSSGCSVSSRPAAPIFRSTRIIPPSGWPTLSPMPNRASSSRGGFRGNVRRRSRCRWCSSMPIWPQIGANPATPPPNATTPDHLVYILYTSGSTGQPKGVMGTHRAVVNRLNWDVTQEAVRRSLCPEDHAEFHRCAVGYLHASHPRAIDGHRPRRHCARSGAVDRSYGARRRDAHCAGSLAAADHSRQPERSGAAAAENASLGMQRRAVVGAAGGEAFAPACRMPNCSTSTARRNSGMRRGSSPAQPDRLCQRSYRPADRQYAGSHSRRESRTGAART